MNVTSDGETHLNLDFNSDITNDEVKRAVSCAKIGKSAGIDGIPTEVLKNEFADGILHRLFSVCFSTGIIPNDWNYSIITPIPKSSAGDSQNPPNYRGISLATACYKLNCDISKGDVRDMS